MHSAMFLAAGVSCLLSVANGAVFPREGWTDVWDSAGCIKEPRGVHLLAVKRPYSNRMTLDICAKSCKDYGLFGLENGGEVSIPPFIL